VEINLLICCSRKEIIDSGVIHVGKVIPDAGVALVEEFFCSYNGSVEHVQVRFDADHAQASDLQITLVSPHGTISILAENHGFSES
jgi:subtilisin-like proprotein convertase family protein